MSEIESFSNILDRYGFPVAFSAGLIFVLWKVLKNHKEERAEILEQHRIERKEVADLSRKEREDNFERYRALDDRAHADTAAITSALKDLEIVIRTNHK